MNKTRIFLILQVHPNDVRMSVPIPIAFTSRRDCERECERVRAKLEADKAKYDVFLGQQVEIPRLEIVGITLRSRGIFLPPTSVQ